MIVSLLSIGFFFVFSEKLRLTLKPRDSVVGSRGGA